MVLPAVAPPCYGAAGCVEAAGAVLLLVASSCNAVLLTSWITGNNKQQQDNWATGSTCRAVSAGDVSTKHQQLPCKTRFITLVLLSRPSLACHAAVQRFIEHYTLFQ
jgi:hypothetical protein